MNTNKNDPLRVIADLTKRESAPATGIWDDHSSVNWVGWDVYWSHVAGQRLNMGGSSAYIDHADAVGSTVMETDPSGAVVWDITRYPWGRIWQQTGTRGSAVFAGLDWQVNDPTFPRPRASTTSASTAG